MYNIYHNKLHGPILAIIGPINVYTLMIQLYLGRVLHPVPRNWEGHGPSGRSPCLEVATPLGSSLFEISYNNKDV